MPSIAVGRQDNGVELLVGQAEIDPKAFSAIAPAHQRCPDRNEDVLAEQTDGEVFARTDRGALGPERDDRTAYSPTGQQPSYKHQNNCTNSKNSLGLGHRPALPSRPGVSLDQQRTACVSRRANLRSDSVGTLPPNPGSLRVSGIQRAHPSTLFKGYGDYREVRCPKRLCGCGCGAPGCRIASRPPVPSASTVLGRPATATTSGQL